MPEQSTCRHNIDMVLVGGTEREFDVYRDWLSRSFGDQVRLRRTAPLSRAASGLDLEAAEIVLFDYSVSELATDVNRVRDRRSVVIVDSQVGRTRYVKAGGDGSRVLTKPLSRRRFIEVLAPLLAPLRAALVKPDAPESPTSLQSMAQRSEALALVLTQIRRVSRSEVTVFLCGETGTEKDACALAIHRLSPRAERPFVAVDCGEPDAELLRRTLLGGSNSSATASAFAQAAAGTLYLRRIDALCPALQTALLRRLASGPGERDGMAADGDCRIICAADQDIRALVDAGQFREDLYYRLFVMPLAIAPLRERRDDILALARHFADSRDRRRDPAVPAFQPEAERALVAYQWPGNTMELQAVVNDITGVQDVRPITLDMLPPAIRCAGMQQPEAGDDHAVVVPFTPLPATPSAAVQSNVDDIVPLWLQEQRIIEAALATCGGHVGRAAQALQISPSTIYRKMQSWHARQSA